jgi:hypothetical protein
MKRSLLLCAVALVSTFSRPGFAQDAFVGGTHAVTTVQVGPQYETFAPEPPKHPVAVTAGSELKLTYSTSGFPNSTMLSAVWYHNRAKLSDTSPVLDLGRVSTEDSGIYNAVFRDASGREFPSTSLSVVVTTYLNPTLINVSSRYDLVAGGLPAIVGFGVTASPDAAAARPKVLIRVVGPSLAKFGVPSPLADPTARLYDANGKEISMGKFFPQVIYPDGSTPESRYRASLAELAKRLGAFAIPTDGSEFVELMDLSAGVYTVHATSKSGKGGTVLVEVYQVPTEATLNL